jgi:hypothetical protein
MSRKEALNSFAGAIAASGLVPNCASSTTTTVVAHRPHERQPSRRQPYIETGDGTRLFYQDWGAGKCILFIHSICLSSQIWQYNMLPLSDRGFRCVAYDRRGHGRSQQPGWGYDYDTLADDLACVINELDLRDVTLVGHSMGAGGCQISVSSRCRASGSHRVGRSRSAVHVEDARQPGGSGEKCV